MEDIKSLILHYLRVYEGRCKPTIRAIEEEIALKSKRNEYYKKYYYMRECFCELENENAIRLIPYGEMTATQKSYYDADKEPIYEIIKN